MPAGGDGLSGLAIAERARVGAHLPVTCERLLCSGPKTWTLSWAHPADAPK